MYQNIQSYAYALRGNNNIGDAQVVNNTCGTNNIDDARVVNNIRDVFRDMYVLMYIN